MKNCQNTFYSKWKQYPWNLIKKAILKRKEQAWTDGENSRNDGHNTVSRYRVNITYVWTWLSIVCAITIKKIYTYIVPSTTSFLQWRHSQSIVKNVWHKNKKNHTVILSSRWLLWLNMLVTKVRKHISHMAIITWCWVSLMLQRQYLNLL